jgi:hypothetical protein
MELVGLDALRKALRDLPEDLRREADVVVRAQADAMAQDTQRAYPEGPTGNLRRGVTIKTQSSSFAAVAIVRSRAKHAHFFETGTGARRTDKGYNRGRHPEPAEADKFVLRAIRARRRLTAALVDIVRRAGFEVSE